MRIFALRSRGPLRATASALVAAVVLGAAVVGSGFSAASGATVSGTPGASGAGDSMFPSMGNGGYDVRHYTINLVWYPSTQGIDAVTTVRAVATQSLSSFDLDLQGLTVQSVEVNGFAATFVRSGHELVITPQSAIPSGSSFTTVVQYSGRPAYYTDPDGSKDGWVATADGATVMSEPVGAMTWYPVNDTPKDKATYTVAISVPNNLTALANGVLASRQVGSARTVWTWLEKHPMACYLATVSIGRYNHYAEATTGGVPLDSYVDPGMSQAATARQDLPGVLTQLSRWFGAYPFESSGIVVDNVPVGYSLETQTRPTYDRAPSDGLLVHELAHQWFGDSVTIRDWSDIWLNEGFATYARWMWAAQVGGISPAQQFRRLYDEHPAGDSFWQVPPGEPGSPKNLFARPVYMRGAMALQALRHRVGSAEFMTIMRRWAAQREYASGTTRQFRALAESVSGTSLGTLFRDWLYRAARPSGY